MSLLCSMALKKSLKTFKIAIMNTFKLKRVTCSFNKMMYFMKNLSYTPG